jgi:hypothetical protein
MVPFEPKFAVVRKLPHPEPYRKESLRLLRCLNWMKRVFGFHSSPLSASSELPIYGPTRCKAVLGNLRQNCERQLKNVMLEI